MVLLTKEIISYKLLLIMKRLNLLIKVLIIIVLLALTPVKKISAYTLLQDDFNDNSITDNIPVAWEQSVGNYGYWTTNNGEVEGSVVKSGPDLFSYLVAGNFSWQNYTMSTKIKGIFGVDKKIMVRFQNPGTRYDISMISESGVYFQKWLNGIDMGYVVTGYNNSNNIWYNLKVEAFNNNFKVYVNDVLLINYYDTNNPILSGKIGLQVWPGAAGSPSHEGPRTTIRYDDVLVTSLDSPTPTTTPTSTPTLIPTPTPTPPTEKVVVVPGMGASWNTDALLNCNPNPSGDWILAPYAEQYYQPLLNSLNKKGVVFNYDWRKDVRNHSDALQNFISKLTTYKVDLVGHSMGGLVGRAYLQETNTDNKLDKMLTVGSPHQGVVQAYPAWSGGEIWKDNLFEKIALTILLKRCQIIGNDKNTIRQNVPSLENLLPIVPYLQNKKTGETIDLGSMKTINNWLKNNPLNNPFGVKLGTLSGKGIPTLKTLQVKQPNKIDLLLGNWLDGKPVGSKIDGDGDGTVLLSSSSNIPTSIKYEINQSHTGLITSDDGIAKIKEFLDLNGTSNSQNFSEPKSALVILSNNSNFWIRDPKGKIIKDKQGLVSFMNIKNGRYQYGIIPKNSDTLFIVAQFLEDDRTFYKEYKFKNKFPKFGSFNFNQDKPIENLLNLQN